MDKNTDTWNPEEWIAATSFMDYETLIIRLRHDLNADDKFWMTDLRVPHNEQEYQQTLREVRKIHKILTGTI